MNAHCRTFCALLLSLSLGVASVFPVCAHEGHVHETEAPPVSVADEPRLETKSGDVELVGIAKDGKLWLYVDRYATNEPLDQLSIQVAEGKNQWAAKAESGGIYSIPADNLKLGGRHEFVFTLTGPQVNDLLIGSMDIPAALESEPAWGQAGYWAIRALVAAVVLWFLIRLARRPARRRAAEAFGVAVLLFLAWRADPSLAQDQSHPAPPSASNPGNVGARPIKQPDGRVFVSKAAQRILGIRTTLAQTGSSGMTVELTGQVAADPNYSGSVQAAQAGTILAPPGGLPNLGQQVKKGQLLAYLKPSLTSIETATQQAQLATLRKDVYLSGEQLRRLKEQYGSVNSNGNSVAIDIAKHEHNTLEIRKAELEKSLSGLVELRAPITGVISSAGAFIGKVAAPGQALFEIVDPGHLSVEALTYDGDLPGQIAVAEAITLDNKRFELTFKGQGYRLRNQAVPLQFGLKAADARLAIGQSVKVRVQTRERIAGIAVPAESIAQDGQDETIVWLHASAEWFTPKKIRSQRLGNSSAVVLEGIAAGDRVVTAGSALLSQVR